MTNSGELGQGVSGRHGGLLGLWERTKLTPRVNRCEQQGMLQQESMSEEKQQAYTYGLMLGRDSKKMGRCAGMKVGKREMAMAGPREKSSKSQRRKGTLIRVLSSLHLCRWSFLPCLPVLSC